MKNRTVALACVVLFVTGAASGKYSGGTGEPNDPYRIATPNDLNDIGNHVEDFNKCFVMVNDINLAAYTGTQFNIIGNLSHPFTGVFDGNNHTISNFSYESNVKDFVGMFGYAYALSAEIKNVTLAEPHVVGNGGEFIGALVGFLREGAMTSCAAQGGTVTGKWYVGGLAGYEREGVISCCESSTTVSADDIAGGIVGEHWYGTLTYCYSSGNVSAGGVAHEASAVGGLVGYNLGTISNCYASGDVSGIDRPAGGLAGVVSGGASVILNCYASGHVSSTSEHTGALVGDDDEGSYTKSFWDSDINPDLTGIWNKSDPNVIGKTTAQMKTESTFTDAGWDFVEVWNIGENQTYPFLRVHPAGDLNHSGLVDWRDFAILAGHWLEGGAI